MTLSVPAVPSSHVSPQPDPPRFDGWPEAQLSAERLAGSLVRCGPGLRGVGWPETPRVRLAALSPWHSERRVAAFQTAAWVWGALRDPGTPLRFSMTEGVRKDHHARVGCRVSELRLRPDEWDTFGRYRVTTPARTICDLLYEDAKVGSPQLPHSSIVAIRLLARLAGGLDRIAEQLHEHRRPYRMLAFERLALVDRRFSGRVEAA